MSLEKTSLPINFAQGLDQKSDPFQVQPGKMLGLQNSVFTKTGRLTKRNGYKQLATLPTNTFTRVTNYSDNLTAIGTSLSAYSESTNAWIDKGAFRQCSLTTLPVARSALNISQADSAVASNGLVCAAYAEINNGVPVHKYSVSNLATGQNIIMPTPLVPLSGTSFGCPKVFIMGARFVIVYSSNIGLGGRLQYITVSLLNPTIATAPVTISSNFLPGTGSSFDGVVANNTLFLSWNGADGAVKTTYLDNTLALHTIVSYPGYNATTITTIADTSANSPVIWTVFHDTVTTNEYAFAVNILISPILAPTLLTTGVASMPNITGVATDGTLTVVNEIGNSYAYDTAIDTNYLAKLTITQAGAVTLLPNIARSVGLASKAFTISGITYLLTAYQSDYQPTYFLMDTSGNVVSKLAYSNGGGYLTTGLPSPTIIDGVATIPYLYRALVQSVNKSQGVVNTAGVYSQTGVNLVSFDLTPPVLATTEIGHDLILSGGLTWMYDGVSPVEQGFHLWPDYVEATLSPTGGFLSPQLYYYQAVYEWTDARGNIFRSAPSLPIGATAVGPATSSVVIDVPTLRLTYKTATPIKIVIYRWSTAQQTYYQITSIVSPTLNDTSVDYITFTDTQADADILGNSILYTTGGVIENIAPPSTDTMALFKSRLFLVDSENRNLLWYSKQVIQNVPVEMSDLFTIYVAPTTAAQTNTGPITALGALDDKLIIFKQDAIYYMTGNGPDNTGINNDFSEPVFITSTVGCSNQQSLVFMPNGLMFQSDKGIWLLGRDLNTTYVGAPVEDFNTDVVQSAINVPGTNQVRFTMASGTTLMYDYYFGQWGTFTNIPAVSGTLFQGLHTYIDSFGRTFQETIGKYLDGSKPVLMSFTTSWLNMAGLQGYERAYFFYILGVYITPHKLRVDIAYDYNSSPSQSTIISPVNFSPAWGNEALWGSGESWGGGGNVEQHRVFLQQQKCQAFQITITEQYDPSFGVVAGAGLTLSGINAIVGMKSGYPRLKASKSVG